MGELERQVAAAAAGAVVENKVRQGRFPRHFATQIAAGFLAIFPESGLVSHRVKAAIPFPVLVVWWGNARRTFAATLRI